MKGEETRSRRGERQQLADAKADARQKTLMASRRVASVVRKCRIILARPEFVELMSKQGIKTIPQMLAVRTRGAAEPRWRHKIVERIFPRSYA